MLVVTKGKIVHVTPGGSSTTCASFDYTDEFAFLVGEAGFTFVVVEGHGENKIIAVGEKSALVGKARAWRQRYTKEIGFEPQSAVTAGGCFPAA